MSGAIRGGLETWPFRRSTVRFAQGYAGGSDGAIHRGCGSAAGNVAAPGGRGLRRRGEPGSCDCFGEILDLAALGFDGVIPEETGRPSYHPATMLKIRRCSLLCGVTHFCLRSALVEAACSEDYSAYFGQYDPDGPSARACCLKVCFDAMNGPSAHTSDAAIVGGARSTKFAVCTAILMFPAPTISSTEGSLSARAACPLGSSSPMPRRDMSAGPTDTTPAGDKVVSPSSARWRSRGLRSRLLLSRQRSQHLSEPG